jgi:hypothetical protein
MLLWNDKDDMIKSYETLLTKYCVRSFLLLQFFHILNYLSLLWFFKTIVIKIFISILLPFLLSFWFLYNFFLFTSFYHGYILYCTALKSSDQGILKPSQGKIPKNPFRGGGSRQKPETRSRPLQWHIRNFYIICTLHCEEDTLPFLLIN